MSYTLRRRLIFAWIFADVGFTIFRVNLFFADAEIEVILRGFRGYQIYNIYTNMYDNNGEQTHICKITEDTLTEFARSHLSQPKK